jgi:hypothetical protein
MRRKMRRGGGGGGQVGVGWEGRERLGGERKTERESERARERISLPARIAWSRCEREREREFDCDSYFGMSQLS